MKYQPPYVEGATPAVVGIHNADADASYLNGDAAAGQEGSYVPGEAVEHTQREIVAIITAAGITPSHTDLTQVARAIQSGALIARTATGTADAITVALAPQPAARPKFLVIKAAAAPTGAATIAVSPLPAVALKRADGTDIQADDWAADSVLLLADDGVAYRVIAGAVAGSGDVEAVIAATSLAGRRMVYSTPGTYTFTVPAGITQVDVEVLAGGGAGGASANGTSGSIAGNAGGGGGAGGYARKLCTVTPGAGVTVTVGAAGAGAANAAGGNGGTSSFGAFCSATGGHGGAWGTNTLAQAGTGGLGTGGDINIPGGAGGASANNSSTYDDNLKLHVLNKGGLPPAGYGTVPWFGTGTDGKGYGTGGNGSSGGSGVAGGDGAGGLVIIRW